MDIAEVITEAKDAMQVRRVFGDPFTGHGTTLIPAASIRGGGGGGQSENPEGRGEGSGGGFGVLARPAGAYVVNEGVVAWRPAIDINRIILGGQIVVIVAPLTLRSIMKARAARRDGDAA
jgi:uncharacterized spore protein YtfJ